MKKLYIPTTTLNFNNILSSESISPRDFYARRGFGYTRWFAVDENAHPSLTLLYSEPRSFTRPKGDLEDHPMLVEIAVDDDCVMASYAPGVYATDSTIYLNPWHTRFIFFSETDIQTALSLSSSSIETKLLKLYRKSFTVMSLTEKYTIPAGNIAEKTNEASMMDDRRLDRMKGILYGYYIGAALSSDTGSVGRLNSLKEIRNIFAAIAAGTDKKPTRYQDERLDTLLREIHYSDPRYHKVREIIADDTRSGEDKTARLLRYIYTSGAYTLGADKTILLKNLASDKSRNASIAWINAAITAQESAMARRRQWPRPADMEITVGNLSLADIKTAGDPIEKQLLTEWCNNVLSSPEFNGHLSQTREALGDAVTLSAKKIYGDAWPGSVAKEFLNSLRRHLRGEEMNVSWNNGPLCSAAAVIIAGDSWERLLSFMQYRGMTDYRLAFAMLGALKGFADMSRDFTDILYACDSRYIAEVYREFHRQLFGTPLPEEQFPENDSSRTTTTAVAMKLRESKPRLWLRKK